MIIMYSLKQISEMTDKPLRTIQNWFKDIPEAEKDYKTNARYFDEETVIKVLSEKNITLNKAEEDTSKDEEKTAQNDAPLREEARQNDADAILTLLESQLDFYKEQIALKDKQIQTLNDSLDKAQTLILREQELNARLQTKLDEIKLLDAPKENTETIINTEEKTEIIKETPKETKKSFWKRLFGN